jgi:hypothetical protein
MTGSQLALFLIALVGVAGGGQAVFWVLFVRHLRRKYPLPEDLQDPDSPDDCQANYEGYYLETRLLDESGAEVRRFRGWRMLARGNGQLCLTQRGLHFWRRGFKEPFWIPYFTMRRVEVVLSKRTGIRGRMSLELDWELAGYRLRSVFTLRDGVSATVRVGQWLEARLP